MKIDVWLTPFEEGELYIINTRWGASDWSVEYANGKRYELKSDNQSRDSDLIVTVFHVEIESVFEVIFNDVGAYRLLDEHGLIDMWDSGALTSRCFKVKDHAWSKESPLSFFMHTNDGWSYIISTGDECVEVVTPTAPKIVFKQKVMASYQ